MSDSLADKPVTPFGPQPADINSALQSWAQENRDAMRRYTVEQRVGAVLNGTKPNNADGLLLQAGRETQTGPNGLNIIGFQAPPLLSMEVTPGTRIGVNVDLFGGAKATEPNYFDAVREKEKNPFVSGFMFIIQKKF